MHPDVKQREVKPLFAISAEAPLVLAVDDHPTNRDLLARQIRLLGLRAETAENGQVALSMWREGRFALIITDCHMPKMDGYELAQEIRKIENAEELGHIPIIAWTANALAEEEGHCHAAGMDELLVKPAVLAQLKQTLARCLSIIETRSAQANELQHERPNKEICPIDYALLDMVVADSADQFWLLKDFFTHIRADYSKLVQMLEQSDCAIVERTSHRMNGSCKMVGAKNMSKACAAIELAARAGDMVSARSSKSSLDEAIAQLETFLIGLESRKVLI
jgi:CheY-like chemotaxis protein